MSTVSFSANASAEHLAKLAAATGFLQSNRNSGDIPVSGLDFFTNHDGDVEDDVDPTIVGGRDELEEEDEPQQVTASGKRKRSTGSARQSNTQRTVNSLKDDGDNTRRVRGMRKMAPLIEYDAPTQTRTYLTPSATSRKPDPQIGNPTKKRRTANDEVPIDDSLQADGSNLGDDGQELPQSLLSSIEIKRRQNTLAARRSRARKQEHVKSLEEEVNKLMHERDAWKQKAEKFEEELRRVTGAGALGESGLQ